MWMSIRFFVKIQKDVHNTFMADRHQAPSYPLRMPSDLKEQVAESAKRNRRSLHAEIISRLTQSFLNPPDALELHQEKRHLQARIDGYERFGRVMEVTQRFLAETLVQTIDRMPAEGRKAHQTVRGLADAVAKNDPRGIGQGFASLFSDDATVYEEMRQVMTELEPAIAAKERGEDLTPYREDDTQKAQRKQRRIPLVGTIGEHETLTKNKSKKGL